MVKKKVITKAERKVARMEKKLREQKMLRDAISDVDNPWEMITLIFLMRPKEVLWTLNAIQLVLNVILLAKYTSVFQMLFKFVMSFFGGGEVGP